MVRETPLLRSLRKITIAALWLLTLPEAGLLPAEEIVVTFRLHAPDLPEETPIYITGSVRGLGSWHPAKVQMKYAGDHVWTHGLTLPKKQQIEYKYTLGSWAREGAGTDGRPLANLVLDAAESIEQRDEVIHWTDRQRSAEPGQITGQVKYHRQIAGEGIRPRDVVVWLPPDYDTSGADYPVLYMHDGQNIVDPRTSAFGVDWQVDETCTRLIAEGRISPLIVVGIYNTPERTREYLPGATGDAYRDFVAHQLKPFIDRNYRTKRSREFTFTGGSSAGGLCAFMLVWENSDVFSKALCMSPSFKYRNAEGKLAFDYVASVCKSERPVDPVFIYIDNGGIGLEKTLQPGIDAMMEALEAKGLKAGQDFHWLHAADDRHHESAWAKRLPLALEILTAAACSKPRMDANKR